MKPKLLDLYCGAGGAAKGYSLTGFDVIGVDSAPQKNYPFRFHQHDALRFLEMNYRSFDAIHASPPCQAYSRMSICNPGLKYPDLIRKTRRALLKTGLPYVMENVEGAPLVNTIVLCGRMFGLRLYRHRLFETNWKLPQPFHKSHTIPASKAGRWKKGTVISVVGHCAPMSEARKAMGIDWMNREELVEAIPPAYTKYVGKCLMEVL